MRSERMPHEQEDGKETDSFRRKYKAVILHQPPNISRI